jgi:hypothetical protein
MARGFPFKTNSTKPIFSLTFAQLVTIKLRNFEFVDGRLVYISPRCHIAINLMLGIRGRSQLSRKYVLPPTFTPLPKNIISHKDFQDGIYSMQPKSQALPDFVLYITFIWNPHCTHLAAIKVHVPAAMVTPQKICIYKNLP